jgi:hypothetical protein
MSKTSRSKSKNFEFLYFNLKEEYAQMQKDNDEICKEYESTIQMLTDSIKELQNQRTSLTKKLSQVEKEKEKLQDKNREKIIDIQDLNKKNQKLLKEILSIKDKNKEKEHQIVILENDTEHYLKLIRQNDAIIEELNYKLEEALEDNVTIQTEFELYKQMMGEKLLRKSDELKEIKSDMFSKNLMIKKLKDNQNKKYINSKYLELDGRSTRKKNINENTKNKIMKKFNIYTSDNNTNISYLKKKQLLNNNFTEPAIQKNNICFTEENIPQNIGTHTIKIKSYVDKKNNGINSLLNSYTNKMSSLETPSNIQMIKQNNSNHSYFSLKYKNEKSNECQEINNFNLNTIDYNDTTSGLSVLQNGKDETFNQDFYDYLLQNLETNRKKANREYECDINNKKIIKNNNAKKKPYKDAFLKKILNSKRINNNLEQLFYYNQRNKASKHNIVKKLNSKRKLLALK